MAEPCSIIDCDKPSRTRGWCSTHYARWLRNGGPLVSKPRPQRPLAERLWEKVRIPPDDCWLWTGSVDACGYGMITVETGKTARVHRVAYELLIGPIPEGLEIDHLCAMTNCVNPDHLEPVTGVENLRREWARRKGAPIS